MWALLLRKWTNLQPQRYKWGIPRGPDAKDFILWQHHSQALSYRYIFFSFRAPFLASGFHFTKHHRTHSLRPWRRVYWEWNVGEYWIELIAIELPCIVLTFPTQIFCRGISGFVAGCLSCVWGRELTRFPRVCRCILVNLFYISCFVSLSWVKYFAILLRIEAILALNNWSYFAYCQLDA